MLRLIGIGLLFLGLVCWRTYQRPSSELDQLDASTTSSEMDLPVASPTVSPAVAEAVKDQNPSPPLPDSSREPASVPEPSLEEVAELNVKAGVIKAHEKAELIEHLRLVQERDAQEREGHYP